MIKMQNKFQENNFKTINKIKSLKWKSSDKQEMITSRIAAHMLQNIRIESVT